MIVAQICNSDDCNECLDSDFIPVKTDECKVIL